MAITDESPVSASNLGAAVGLAAGEGGTGGKPVSAENLAALIEGGGLLALETIWEGRQGGAVEVDASRYDQRLYVIDVEYNNAGTSEDMSVAFVMNPPTLMYSLSYCPESMLGNMGNYHDMTINLGREGETVSVRLSESSDVVLRVRGGVSLAEALGAVVA